MSTKDDLKRWLPTSKKEVEMRGWDQLDIILFSGDAYVDHPSFANAVIGRVLEAAGYKVAIVPQPNWRDDLRDFKKLGTPRLFFGVSPGNMDSMVNHYTAAKRRRSDDAYTPDLRPDMRPDYPSIVYTKILRELFPDTPILLGGIEASLRRLTHYDYWQDKLLPGMPFLSAADLILYGLGEKSVVEIADLIHKGVPIDNIKELPQVAYLTPKSKFTEKEGDIWLNSYEECLKDKLAYAKNFRQIEEQSNSLHAHRLLEGIEDKIIVVNPPYPLPTQDEVDSYYRLPYTRLPHPRYQGKTIRAYEMIKHSINMHRGCFGGCAFCTISAHQGKFIVSRSKKSIVEEAKKVTEMPDFKGYISDLGGPSANMYQMRGKDLKVCGNCLRPSCIFPKICPNLNADHSPLLEVYHEVDALPKVKKSFIGSGVRYDLLIHEYKQPELKEAARAYTKELVTHHVSGRLKVAPEHTSESVLRQIRKPSFENFYAFKNIFDRINQEEGLKQQLIPYFISSHPGCREEDMAELALITKSLHFQLEQVQDFTPTPMTVSTVIYYSGYHPYTLQKVYTAHTKEEKEAQRQFFFWYQPDKRAGIIRSLNRIGRKDLVDKLFGNKARNNKRKNTKHKSHKHGNTSKR